MSISQETVKAQFALTGQHAGHCPKDKFFVEDGETSKDRKWWTIFASQFLKLNVKPEGDVQREI